MNNANAPSALGASGACGRRAVNLAVGVALLGALSAVSGVASAQSTVGPVMAPSDDSLTYKGITLYGIIDVGFQYETHGAPFSDYFMASSADIVQKDSNHSATGLTSNNLSQSRIGLAVLEPLGVGDWYGIGRVETYFNPSSGDISDALKSLAQNNGRAVTAQTTNLDSSIAGELFEQAYLGLSSATFGAVTFGRQNTLLADGIAKYDPNAASQAFSIIGLSGTTAGGGDTQDRRLDDSVKYSEAIGPVHIGILYKFSQSFGAANTAEQFDVGFDYAGLSVDALYAHVRDAVAASALSAAQEAIAVAAPNYLSTSNSVSGTISDNQSFTILGLYNLGFIPVKVYAGYEHIQFGNPKNPLAIGFDDIGGYKLGAVNNTAFPTEKVLQVAWAGVKYTWGKKLDLTAAWYGYDQNSYGVGKGIAGCSSTVAGTCSGTETVLSVDADYRWTKRFDTYAGVMYSSVSDGLANGYIKTTNADPTIGFRFRF
ncbi:MAG TPA: porin [Steroidobacteraceae bacterium]|nr:porin [Steroidobacteraceae bacterium]